MANAAEKVEEVAENMVQRFEEPKQPYLKLNADCWEHVYDYLLLKEIVLMGQTCKRMNLMSGYYIREYYPQVLFKLTDEEIRFEDVSITPHFFPFIGWLSISGESKLDFLSNDKTFKSLKTIVIKDRKLIGIDNMQNALKQVETVQLIDCEFVGSFFVQLANYCPKLKCLTLLNCELLHTDLFSQYYPALESLKFWSFIKRSQFDEFKIFLEKHSRLKRFQTNFSTAYRQELTETNIQLDLLGASIVQSFADSAFISLKALHQRGFYKSLQLTFYDSIDPSDIGRLTDALSTLPRLEKLTFYRDPLYDLSLLTDLTELIIFNLSSSANIETLAKSVPKLKRLSCLRVDFDAILPFIRHSKRLQTMKLVCPSNVEAFLNLDALDHERQKVENASPIVIYLEDSVYSFLKCESKILNLNMVKIERIEQDHTLLLIDS